MQGFSNYFFAGGEGIPIEDLHNARFRQILALPLYYEMHTDNLSESLDIKSSVLAENRSDGM